LVLFGLHRYRVAKLTALATLKTKLSRATQIASFAEMSASIAHEINQPLAAIVTHGRACLRWLDRPVPDLDEARKAAQSIVADGNRGSEVVARIRALLKKEPVVRIPVDINEVIQEILRLTDSELEGIVLRTELGTDLPHVLADRVQLQQVLLNLITNAIDAMKPVADPPHVLSITTKKEKSGGVLVAVADSGVGLGPKKMEELFDTFYTTKPGGLGLGLSISRSIIETHGGRLWAERNNGLGAIFLFTLPSAREGAVE
jgi:C4-dicarboxylate-specific signal transduction histidine kinase